MRVLPDPEWQYLEPVERLVRLFTSFDGCELPASHAELAWLVGGGVDDDAWAWQGATWFTNCGEAILGALQRACMDDAGRRAVHRLLTLRSENGTSLSHVVQIILEGATKLRDSSGRILSTEKPEGPALLWYASRPQRRNADGTPVNDDHVALQTGPYAGALTPVCEGGGGGPKCHIGASRRDTMWSWGRPLVAFRLIESLRLPAARERPAPAFDGAEQALAGALEGAHAASGQVWSESIHERETLAPPEE
jgi:hypothetical protein